MLWIEARSSSTDVVYRQSIGNLTRIEMIGESMSVNGVSNTILFPGEHPVPTSRFSPGPNDAVTVWGDSFLESLFHSFWDVHGLYLITEPP